VLFERNRFPSRKVLSAFVVEGPLDTRYCLFPAQTDIFVLEHLVLWCFIFVVTESSTGPIKRFKETNVAHVGGHG